MLFVFVMWYMMGYFFSVVCLCVCVCVCMRVCMSVCLSVHSVCKDNPGYPQYVVWAEHQVDKLH